MNAVVEGFRRVGDFQGRTPQRRFWPYVVTIVLVHVVLGTIGSFGAMAPAMSRLFNSVAAAARAAKPDGSAAYNPAAEAAFTRDFLGSVMGPVLWVGVMLSIVSMLLLLAITVRRLHDSGKTGWWSLLPIPGTLASYGVTMAMMSRMDELLTPTGMTPAFQLYNALLSAIYWGGILGLLFLVTRSSTPGDNRFGPASGRGRDFD